MKNNSVKNILLFWALIGIIFPCSNLFAQSIELGRSSITQDEEPLIRTPDSHGKDPIGANSAWFKEFRRDVSNDSIDPHSDQMLNRLRKASGTIDAQWSGSWTPSNWAWYTFPFQVVSGNISLLTIPGTWSYDPASNGPYMLPPEPVIYEGSTDTTYPVSAWADGGDHHLCVYVRDESSGGYKELWEYYQAYVTKNVNQITAVAGASWRKFDLLNGETPAAGVPSVEAAGMMIMPLVVRYDEVARGSINHALRFCVNNSDISPTFKWPARTAAGAWNPETGMPYGTRLRIKASWWNAKADSVLGTSTQARIIGEAMRRYGLILADGSGGSTIQLQGVADLRWESKLHDRLNSIPVAALEVVSTPPLLQITGPTYLQVGKTGTWILTFLPNESPVGDGSNINIWDSSGKEIQYAWSTINETHRSDTVQYTFTKTGIYTIAPYENWNTGFGPYRIRVDTIPTYTLTVISGSGSGDDTAGAVVHISANTPSSGKVFDKWTGATTGITNINAASTTITMPSANITITATYKKSIGLNDNDISEIEFYPNPVYDVININQAGTVSICDFKGIIKIQKEIKSEQTQIDVSKLPEGIYIIRISNENGTKIGKFFKD
jgi:hypothetical protein